MKAPFRQTPCHVGWPTVLGVVALTVRCGGPRFTQILSNAVRVDASNDESRKGAAGVPDL